MTCTQKKDGIVQSVLKSRNRWRSMMQFEENKNTSLIYELDGDDYQPEPRKVIGIGISTFVGDKIYRGAVKIPKDIDHEKVLKIWQMLAGMLANPTHPACGCVGANEMLVGNERTLDDYDNFVKEGIVIEWARIVNPAGAQEADTKPNVK